jgi:hypothetical protein
MNLSEPSSVICPSLDGPVLMVLAGTTRPLSGREIARLTKRGSWAGVRKVLQRLVSQGIVAVQDAPPVLLYSLNRDHLAAPAVDLLADLKDELVRRLSRSIMGWPLSPVYACLFGSAARGDGGARSDIDLFIVRPSEVGAANEAWWNQVGRLMGDIARWTGNNASVSEVGLEELQGPGAEEIGRTFAKHVRSEGINLFGSIPTELEAIGK